MCHLIMAFYRSFLGSHQSTNDGQRTVPVDRISLKSTSSFSRPQTDTFSSRQYVFLPRSLMRVSYKSV